MKPDIQSILAGMTLEEKAALCTGASAWTTTPVERLGVPEMFVADGPHGVRRMANPHHSKGSLPATCFPTASCMASTWDVDLIYALGQALAEECIALKVDVVLGPGTNMKRSPLGGRNFEYYSEDPYLAGQMAASFITGVQSKGVGTSLKHFAANNQETQRMLISARVDERTLREIYLPAFETAVKKAQPWTVMCAYNKINGTYGSENHRLLVDILKNEWAFQGLVVSDWGAVHNRVTALKSGLDLEMPGPRDRRVQAVVGAVHSGDLDESIVDEAVRRILRIVFMAAETPKGAPFDASAHHALARRVAAEGMVLLKNNGILPLQSAKRIAVIGRAAQEAHFQGGGSSHINPTQVDRPFEELQKVAGDAELSYAEGYPEGMAFDQSLIDAAANMARPADVALLYLALPEAKESEGYDRTDLDLTGQEVALIKAVTSVQPETVVILNNGAPVAMADWIDGPAAVLEAWMMGQAGGGAIADVLYGRVNPSGKLAETFPIRLADTPAYINFPGGAGEVLYGEGIFIGYRYYDARAMPVQFPFGHGLSYTTFAYTNPRVSATSFRDVDGLTVAVDVTNTGKVAGKEVVQVYVHDHKSRLARPPQELKGFAKVELEAGQTRTVAVSLDFRAFAYFHPGYRQWITEDGEFDIRIGASASDIRCTLTVTLQCTLDLPSILNRDSTLRDWVEDPRGRRAMEPFLHLFTAPTQAAIAAHSAAAAKGDTAMMGNFMLELPLREVLYFEGVKLPVSPEDMLERLLAQAHGRPT